MNDQCQELDVERFGHGPCLGRCSPPKSDFNRNGVVSGFHGARYHLAVRGGLLPSGGESAHKSSDLVSSNFVSLEKTGIFGGRVRIRRYALI